MTDSTKNSGINIPLGEQSKAIRRQLLMAVLGNVGSISTGIAYGLPTIMYSLMKEPSGYFGWTDSQVSWFASLTSLFCPVGGLLSGALLDRYGRKNTLYILNVMSIIGWILMLFIMVPTPNGIYIQILISRLVNGVASGLVGPPIGIYCAEISLPKIRSILILGFPMSIATGTSFCYFLGYLLRDDWQLVTKIILIYQIIGLLCVIPMPESPSWLLSKGRVNEAKSSLNYFRGLKKSPTIDHPEVAAEYAILEKYVNDTMGAKKPSLFKSFHEPEVYKPFLILIGMFTFMQITGVLIVIVYAAQIAIEAGVKIDPFLCAMLIGATRFIMIPLLGIILEKWGRRRCAMISSIGMAICMFVLATYNSVEFFKNMSFIPVLALVAYVVTSSLGLHTLPFFMISELFPQKVRGPASGLTLAIGIFIAFLSIKAYPGMKNTFGKEYCFAFFAISAMFALAFVYWFLPETRGRTLMEIEEEFRQGKRKRKNQIETDPIELQISLIKSV